MKSKNIAIAVRLFPIILLTSSCGRNPDLAKVQRFSELANSAAEQFPAIASDIYGSCIRAAEYQPILLESKTPFQLRESALTTCEQNPSKVEEQLLKTHSVLTSYLASLGELASDKTVNLTGLTAVQESFKQLPTRISEQSIPALTSEQREAGIGILSIVSQIIQSAVERSRFEKVQKIIVGADDSLQILIQGFETIIERGYFPYLKDEETAIDNYYEIYIGGVLRHKTESDTTRSLTDYSMNLQDQWRSVRGTVQKRRQVAKQYLDLLRDIAGTHQSLKSKFHQGKAPTTAELNQLFDKYNARLEKLVKEFHVAFGK